MSYDVDSFRVKEIRDFKMTELPKDNDAEICDFETDVNGYIIKIDYAGEGSGYYWDKLIELFKNSSGYLRALVVWEGGNTVKMLTVKDGDVKESDIP